jgi:16S rRNA G527 N7-methylase RsmG
MSKLTIQFSQLLRQQTQKATEIQRQRVDLRFHLHDSTGFHTAFLREIESETGRMLESVEHHRNRIELVANNAEELLDLKRSVYWMYD